MLRPAAGKQGRPQAWNAVAFLGFADNYAQVAMEVTTHQPGIEIRQGAQLHCPAAQASPSVALPVAIRRVKVQFCRLISATWLLLSQET
jgi:hypothetical protein